MVPEWATTKCYLIVSDASEKALCILQFLSNVLQTLFLSANQLPAGLITTDGQQQNVMVYTTSYQQVPHPIPYSPFCC